MTAVKKGGGINVEQGARVFVHQAFRCCPYAAMITARIHDYLEANGFPVCDEPEEASALVVNTCGFNAGRSEQAVRTIGLLRRRAPAAAVVVAGCLTRIERGRVRGALRGCAGCALIGPKEHEKFDDIFRPRAVPFGKVRTNLYKDRYSSKDPRLGLFQILVSTGCMNRCRYCVINRAKGRVESKPLAGVLDEVGAGMELGHRDIFIVGDDISGYGADLGSSVVDLLGALASVGEPCRFSFEAFEPSGFIGHLPALLPIFGKGRFAWIVFPVQSGSDRMLEAMGRAYTRRQVEETLGKLRAAAPGMIISTDFIFGYPSETAGDFSASLDLADLFDYANFNEYEQRPGTPPVDLGPGDLEPRRKAVLDFLGRQGSQVRVLTRNRVLPYDAWTGKDGDEGGRGDLSGWASAEAGKIRRLVERSGAGLGQGWRLDHVDEDRGGLLLALVREGTGETMTVLLTPRCETSPCMAHAAQYNLSLVASESVEGLDAGRSAALGALGRLLETTGGE